MDTPQAKTNIILLTDCLADLTGGAERQIYELAKGLDKDKFNVTVASLECVGQAPRQLVEGIGCRLETFRVVRVYGLSGFIQGLKFFRFLKTARVDIVQTYHFSSDIWGVFWAHLAGVPVIISNRRDMGFWRKNHHAPAYRFINRWVKKIVTVTESVKKMVIETEGVAPSKVEVICNGVDVSVGRQPSDVRSLKEELGIKENELVVIHVANLKPVKGHRFLLRAFAEIIRQVPHVKLLLIGKDELNGSLHRLASQLDIANNVLFLGTRQDVPDLLSAADICVLPSLSEGMSNAILEYMAAGKPVVATNVGGNPELIKNGFNGFLVAVENVEELKNALLALIKDAGKRQAMGANGFTRVKQEFSMEKMVRKYEELFNPGSLS